MEDFIRLAILSSPFVIVIAVISGIASILSPLKKCGACRKPVSKAAVTCPNCGDPQS